ncbi:hypothetical protein ABFS83_01G023400 [Erythranthe nasuta]
MSFTNWKNTRSKSVRLGENYMQTEHEHSSNYKWLMFWRRIKRGKKNKSSDNSPLPATQKTYDPQTYLQNFDEGSDRIEPDNLYRSFSARYANHSVLLNHRKENDRWIDQ